MSGQEGGEARKPNWLLIKEACLELAKSGKTVFTRKEIAEAAFRKDPSRSDMSLDFEIDLVTVNSNSKDKYKDPEKLFLFRLGRGRYTLYDPEVHGPLDKYTGIPQQSIARKQVVAQVLRELEAMGFEASENRSARPLAPDIVARANDKKLGVWIVDPSVDRATQLKVLALAIGSSLIDREFDARYILVPQDLADRVSEQVKRLLDDFNIKIGILKEEKKYSLIL